MIWVILLIAAALIFIRHKKRGVSATVIVPEEKMEEFIEVVRKNNGEITSVIEIKKNKEK